MSRRKKNDKLRETDAADREWLEIISLCLVKACVRDSLEDLHAGISPGSVAGDYTDVKVVTPLGEIPWNQLSRISDAEMKELMIRVINRVFTFLLDPAQGVNAFTFPVGWNKPMLDTEFQQGIALFATQWKGQ